MYNKKNIEILSVDFSEKVVKLHNKCEQGSQGTLTILNEDIEDMVNNKLLPVAKEEVYMSISNRGDIKVRDNSGLVVSTIIGKNSKELSELLMNNIKKVQEDANYIPQAEAVNNQVKSIIDLAKVEADMLKIAASLNK